MTKDKQLKIFNELNTLVSNNKRVINAIDSGGNINIAKAIKASMKSNTNLALIIKQVIYDSGKDESFSYGKKTNSAYPDLFSDLFK